MSRIGKLPVVISPGVNAKVVDREVSVSKGDLVLTIVHRPEVDVIVDDEVKEIRVARKGDARIHRAMHGMTRAMIANMVIGVTEGYSKSLEITGVGWNAQLQGNKLNLNIGYADTRVVEIPTGINCDVQQSVIKISGPDKQLVGQVAARIRGHRPPEPYNGKGIKYSDETIIRKQGKAFSG